MTWSWTPAPHLRCLFGFPPCSCCRTKRRARSRLHPRALDPFAGVCNHLHAERLPGTDASEADATTFIVTSLKAVSVLWRPRTARAALRLPVLTHATRSACVRAELPRRCRAHRATARTHRRRFTAHTGCRPRLRATTAGHARRARASSAQTRALCLDNRQVHSFHAHEAAAAVLRPENRGIGARNAALAACNHLQHAISRLRRVGAGGEAHCMLFMNMEFLPESRALKITISELVS